MASGAIEAIRRYATLLAVGPLLVVVVAAYLVWALIGKPGEDWMPLVVAVLVNPALLAGLFLVLQLGRYSRALRLVDGDEALDAGRLRRLLRRYEAMRRVLEAIVRVPLVRNGLYVAHFVESGWLHANRPTLGINAVSTSESEAIWRRRQTLYECVEMICDFVIAGSTRDTDGQRKLVKGFARGHDLASELRKIVLSALDDGPGPGFLSALNGLYLLSLLLGLPEELRSRVEDALKELDLNAPELGWLSQRFLQTAMVLAVRDQNTRKAIVERLKPIAAETYSCLGSAETPQSRTICQYATREILFSIIAGGFTSVRAG